MSLVCYREQGAARLATSEAPALGVAYNLCTKLPLLKAINIIVACSAIAILEQEDAKEEEQAHPMDLSIRCLFFVEEAFAEFLVYKALAWYYGIFMGKTHDLLKAADQYILDGLKRLYEYTIAHDIKADNLALMYDLSETYNAVSLRNACILFVLEQFDKLHSELCEARAYIRV
nr:hypothetical protein [Tanacetum cinerariifolium]GEY57761.1 hypothetical protein [Tanacetum cinerariifolium]GEY58157.1 hypothetical protein [Tanacetum cinerariifolium]